MLKRIIQGIIFIGFSVQIALGLCWMCCNMGEVQDFAQVSAGIYGWAVRLLGRAYPVMYVLQLLAAGYAGQRLVSRLCSHNPDKWENRLFALWGSLALMTLPMAMQCHMALLPCSLVCSAGLLELSFCCELLEQSGNARHRKVFGHAGFPERPEALDHREIFGSVPFVGLWVCYFAQALLMPEYIFLGALPVAVMLVMLAGIRRADGGQEHSPARLKHRVPAGAKTSLKAFVLLAVAAAAIFAVGVLAARTGQKNAASAENDISGMEWTLVKRLCWPTLWVDYERMPEPLKEATAGAVWESTYYPGNMDRVLKPAIEAAMSAGEAKPLLAEAAACSWEIHSSMIVRQVGWDVLGYCVSPVILQIQLSGGAYESYSGRNYEIMRRSAPVLTKHYVNYGGWWFVAAAVLTVLLLIVRLVSGDRPYGRREGRLSVIVLCFAVGCIFWYTVQGAGIMDYKHTVFINQLWFLWNLKTVKSCEG